MLKKIINASAIALLSLPSFAVTNSNFKYDLSIDTGGNFNIVIKTQYPATKSLAEIIKYSSLSEAVLKAVDSTLISSKFSNDPKMIIYNRKGNFYYKQITKSSKSGMTATIKNDCSLYITEDGYSISNKCKITSSSAPIIGTIFDYGSSQILCKGAKGYKKFCTMTIKGRADSINIPFRGRTEERLAVSGAVHTITSTFKIYYGAINGSKAMSEAKSDRFFSNNISGLWGSMIKHLKKEQYLKANLLATSGVSGYYVRTK